MFSSLLSVFLLLLVILLVTPPPSLYYVSYLLPSPHPLLCMSGSSDQWLWWLETQRPTQCLVLANSSRLKGRFGNTGLSFSDFLRFEWTQHGLTPELQVRQSGLWGRQVSSSDEQSVTISHSKSLIGSSDTLVQYLRSEYLQLLGQVGTFPSFQSSFLFFWHRSETDHPQLSRSAVWWLKTQNCSV